MSVKVGYLTGGVVALGQLLPDTAWASITSRPPPPPAPLSMLLVMMVIGVPVYFLPAIIGRKRQVNNVGWLFVVNLLLGFTGLGWIACLLWAVCGQTKAQDAYWRRQVGPS